MSTGASLTLVAYSASTFETVTNSFIAALQFFRMNPSTLMRPCPWSSGYAGHALAAVGFLPSIWTTSPTVTPKVFMVSESILAMLLPTSRCCFASCTFSWTLVNDGHLDEYHFHGHGG